MKSVYYPLTALVLVLCILGYSGLKQNEKLAKISRSAKSNELKFRSNLTTLKQLEEQNSDYFQQLSQARLFLSEWENTYARYNVGGVESRVQELGVPHEVTVPLPRLDAPMKWSETEDTTIFSKLLSVKADGSLTSLIRYIGDIERTIQLGFLQQLTIQYGERQPRMDLSYQLLHRDFADTPQIDDDVLETYPAAVTGIFARRPDLSRFVIGQMPENLLARSGARASTAAAPKESELSTFIPNLQINGIIWAEKTEGRRVMANGYILRPGQAVPRKMLADTKAVITLTEIGPRFVRFRIETEELNPATSKMEKNVKIREVEFSLFPDLNSEG